MEPNGDVELTPGSLRPGKNVLRGRRLSSDVQQFCVPAILKAESCVGVHPFHAAEPHQAHLMKPDTCLRQTSSIPLFGLRTGHAVNGNAHPGPTSPCKLWCTTRSCSTTISACFDSLWRVSFNHGLGRKCGHTLQGVSAERDVAVRVIHVARIHTIKNPGSRDSETSVWGKRTAQQNKNPLWSNPPPDFPIPTSRMGRRP